MIWGISWILMRTVASLKFALQCSTFIKNISCLSQKKYREVMCCNTKEWCKIWIETDKYFEKQREEFDKFWPKTLKPQKSALVNFTRALTNLKICTLRVFFLSKVYNVELKITEELCIMTLKVDVIFREKLTGGLKNGKNNLVNFHRRSWKSENLHYNGSFCQWHKKFQLTKYRRVISHDTKDRSKLWRKTDFLFEKWHEEFGEF